MTNDNQDALRCAKLLRTYGDHCISADHLERLVAENEQKESALKIVEATCDDFANQIEAKDALLRQAVEVADAMSDFAEVAGFPAVHGRTLAAAIRQHLEGKA